MNRPILGFDVDAAGDPVARLSCGHRQHVRHQPPMINRPWVTSVQGREAMLGRPLNCLRCDRFEWPENYILYKQTPVFSEMTVPRGLLRDHATKPGVWAKIKVLEGKLRYRAEALRADVELSSERPGIIVPEVLHCVEPVGSVRFCVEFFRAEVGGNEG